MKVISIDVGIKNLSYVILKDTKIFDWAILNIEPKKNASLCETMVYTLDEHLEKFVSCDHVIIEKQPSRNNKMRIVEGLLNAYFVIKGKCDKSSTINKVITFSAKHKLNDHIKKMKNFVGKGGYTARKKLSVEFTKQFLTEHEQDDWVHKTFNASKKKDDLADCLLQGLKYLDIDISDNTNAISIVNDVNESQNAKVVCRKPTDSQIRKKAGLSKSNIKWYINEYKKENPGATHDQVLKFVKGNKKMSDSSVKHYSSVEECVKYLNVTKE
jgi:hypothetical protein